MAEYDDIMAQEGELAAIQIMTKRVVAAFPECQGITVLHEQARDLTYQIEQSIADIGICITVLTASADDDSPNVPDLMLDKVYVVIEVREDVLINRSDSGTKIPSSKLADVIARRLKQGMSTVAVIGPHTIVPRKLRMIDEEGQAFRWHVICEL